MFDFALINLTKDDLLWIQYHIMKYRNIKMDDPRTSIQWATRCMIHMANLGLYIDKRKINHIQAVWS